ncbi:helix-turn-helix transcriptional regulator [Kitasatospora griseola]|uniref:helix-turn-helix transcriptional regulator n=1 Tax=Kitasatospora griseola TaxID=2064 RepID=UPI003412ADA4
MAELRTTLGYSQERLAEQLGIATSTVVRWESGKATPRPYQRLKLAQLLKVTASELDALLASRPTLPPRPVVPKSRDSGDAEDMKRRDILGLLAVTGALVALPRSAAGPASPTAGAAETLNSHIWQVFSLSESKQAVDPLVRHQLGILARELESAGSETERKRLCALTADLYQVAGEVFFDGNRYTDAAHCYTLAATAAKEAGDFDLWACAMTRHAFVEIYERRFTAAAPILEAAARVAERGDSQLSTRYWVAAVQAEAHAGLGDLYACSRSLDRAEQVHTLSGQFHNGGWLRFDGSRLAEERGTCYLELGRPDLAEQSLSTALGQSSSLRRRGALLAELAALGAQRGDVDQVVHYSGAAIALAGRTGSGWIRKKLEGLQGRLAPLMADGRISDLHGRISALSQGA